MLKILLLSCFNDRMRRCRCRQIPFFGCMHFLWLYSVSFFFFFFCNENTKFLLCQSQCSLHSAHCTFIIVDNHFVCLSLYCAQCAIVAAHPFVHIIVERTSHIEHVHIELPKRFTMRLKIKCDCKSLHKLCASAYCIYRHTLR